MKKSIVTLSSVFTLLIGLALAAAPAQARQKGPQIDPSTRGEVRGTVVDFQAGRGEGMATIVVNAPQGKPMTVRLGPHWFIEQAGFTAKPGDQVDIVTYDCPNCDADAVAGSVQNVTNGETLNLRNYKALPEWMSSMNGRHGMHGKKMMGHGHGKMMDKSDSGQGRPSGI